MIIGTVYSCISLTGWYFMTILGQYLFFPRDFTCMMVVNLIVTEKCDGYAQVNYH
jgi:hypothetical protein